VVDWRNQTEWLYSWSDLLIIPNYMYIIIYKVINILCVFTISTNVNKIFTNLFNYKSQFPKIDIFLYNSSYLCTVQMLNVSI
jgi:hypothetical protein